MIIGIDFDNTIANYEGVFSPLAVEKGLLPAGFHGTKKKVRDAIRKKPNGEMKWQQLQGLVYGRHMHRAEMFAGVDSFIRICQKHNVPVHIVSHKTRTNKFDPDKLDLREAALEWLKKKGFFDEHIIGLKTENIFFENNRKPKIARINELGCTHFIDDLAELFEEPSFPDNVHQILFSTTEIQKPNSPFTVMESWGHITRFLFKHSHDDNV